MNIYYIYIRISLYKVTYSYIRLNRLYKGINGYKRLYKVLEGYIKLYKVISGYN